MLNRPNYEILSKRIAEPRRFIQVLVGPRQVGKTTIVLTLCNALPEKTTIYVSADDLVVHDGVWLQTQWERARLLCKQHGEAVLVINEVQKLENWAEKVKKLWDEDTRLKNNIKLILLGTSALLMQKGLTESLAGRFELLPTMHWSFPECEKAFDLNLDQYIYFGAYPGAANIIDDETRWANYISDSLIETTISRDILLMNQVNKPALLRRLFHFGCTYSSQIVSYQKMLGQLQDAGNTTTLAHYLDLLNGAGLLCGLQKFAGQEVRKRGSSPKFQVYNNALISAQSGFSFSEAKSNKSFWGRLVESTVGGYLVNAIKGKGIQLYYWREADYEVDFILQKGEYITAIEVKSNGAQPKLSGMKKFNDSFHPSKMLLIGEQGIPTKEFISENIETWLN